MNSTIDSSARIMEAMTELRATPVVKDKYWIVEDEGGKIATILAVEEGGFVYVHNNKREAFPTVKMLKSHYNIEFVKPAKVKKEKPAEFDVYGWPCSHQPYNPLYDVPKRLPIYAKTSKSKSYFCAGYYLVKFANNWAKAYCPKLITLQRYEFQGPFCTKEQMTEQLRIVNGQ